MLKYVPGVQEACNEEVRDDPLFLAFIPDCSKTQEMCNEAVHLRPYLLQYVPYRLRSREICGRAVRDDSSFLQFVPDWFVTRERVDIWYDDYYDDDNEDKFFEWCEGYKKRKVEKTKIKEELLPIAWHPSRYWDWCMSEYKKKKRQKNCGHRHRLFCI